MRFFFQDKRAVVTICYSGGSGLRPFFLTAAKRIKASFPDVMIERRVLPSSREGGDDSTFEVLVDGKVVIGKTRNRSAPRGGSSANLGSLKSVFVSMEGLGVAISKARRRKRPTTSYVSDEDESNRRNGKNVSPAAIRLEVLRKSKQEKMQGNRT